ncbi:lactonase family protein [Candidimonas nitroreducens]|uniref:Hemagglutinin n=1 Tax=Candidimonas nitroreducens TaxID=683354 RepID=A0A225LYD3_9BURK|nr:lactonase family protein [Candidimonas nitroreducens]OWT54197.1 hemagglutinin [Candidimonas nitroreducens]
MTYAYAYVGSRTTRERNARGAGISAYAYDAATGALKLAHVKSSLTNPSYLAVNRRGDRLYTVHGDGNAVSVLSIEAGSGALRQLQYRECAGRNLVHLALSPQERFLAVADHLGNNGGTIIVFPLRGDGTLDPASEQIGLPGDPGPHRTEQPHAKPHATSFTPDGRFLIVPDKGLDRVFSLQATHSGLDRSSLTWAQAREASGPRHVALHPTAPYAYVINELDSTIVTHRINPESGAMTPLQVLSSLPDTYTGNNRAAGITVSADGHTLYASNRGHDSITVFRIDRDTGFLAYAQSISSQGAKPRHFTLSPDGAWLYALNEDSDSIALFAVDKTTGLLSGRGVAAACGSPVCMVFAAC